LTKYQYGCIIVSNIKSDEIKLQKVKIMVKFLAIDIGGSKTKFVVFDAELNILHTCESRGYGLSTDSDDDIPEFSAILSRIDSDYSVCSVAVNLGGKNKEQIFRIVSSVFPESKVSVWRESEGRASFALGNKYGADAVLLAGTGTIVTSFDKSGKSIISGGWGMNIGDGGSGYYIGLEAVKQSLAALDDTAPLTELQKEITGLDSPISPYCETLSICKIRDEVRSRIFPLDRKNIASYAKVVARHCENGEYDALLIMRDAAREMASLVANCVNKLLPFKARKVVVSGGLVRAGQFWKEEFEKNVALQCDINEFVYENDGILLGTQLLAIEQKNMEV